MKLVKSCNDENKTCAKFQVDYLTGYYFTERSVNYNHAFIVTNVIFQSN